MSNDIFDIQNFLAAIKENSNYDFSGYSANSLKRRIIKILHNYSMQFDEMVEKVRNDQDFIEEVVKKITVNTTDFFRDADLWIYLKENLLPMFSRHNRINVWLPGCSTGQEVYSLMILLNEVKLLNKTDIYGSDLNEDALEFARKGIYQSLFSREYVTNFDKVLNPQGRGKKVEHDRYFNTMSAYNRIEMKSFLAKKPIYFKMDLIKEENPIEKKFDIIFCRNVIIYYNKNLQDRVLDLLYRNLNDNACLVLGKHESIAGTFESRFLKKDLVYFKRPSK